MRSQAIAITLVACILGTGCTAPRHLTAKVRSLPSSDAAPSGHGKAANDGALSPVPAANARIASICDTQEEVLGFTDDDGQLDYSGDGAPWGDACTLTVSTFDRRHQSYSESLDSLCREQAGEPTCTALHVDVTLVRNDDVAQPSPVQVRFESDQSEMTLYGRRGGRLDRICTAPCTTSLVPGEHMFALGIGDGTPWQVWAPDEEASQVPYITVTEDAVLRGRRRGSRALGWLGLGLMLTGLAGILVLARSGPDDSGPNWVGVGMASGMLLGLPLVLFNVPRAELDVTPIGAPPSPGVAGSVTSKRVE